MGDKSKLKIGTYQNPNSGRSKESIDNYVKGMREKKYGGKKLNTDRVRKIKMLTGGQAKIAAKAPPPNKIDEKDFAVLRAEKAKGRGMGLQDEKVKPGKVQKAALGMLALGIGAKKLMDKKGKGLPPGLGAASLLAKKKKEILGKRMGGVMKYKRGSGLDLPVISSIPPSIHKTKKAQKTAVMKEQFNKQKSRMGKNPNKTLDSPRAGEKFLKRRKELGAAGKALAATRVGKMLLPVAAAVVAAQQYLKGKMKKDKNKKTLKDFREQKKPGVPSEKTKTINSALNKLKAKKMGGGMMQRPMGYSKGSKKPMGYMGGGMMQKPMGYTKGTMVKARGCKLGRTKPTKIT